MQKIAAAILTPVVLVCAFFVVKSLLEARAKRLLGGDVEIVQFYTPVSIAGVAWFSFNSEQLSRVNEVEAIATHGGAQIQALVRAADGAYPLYGKLALGQQQDKNIFFNHAKRHSYGVAASRSLLDALNIKPGDECKIGDIAVTIQAVVDDEPDRNAGDAEPHIFISIPGLRASGLIQPGNRAIYRYRMRLAEDVDLNDWKKRLAEQFPDAHWTIRDWRDALP